MLQSFKLLEFVVTTVQRAKIMINTWYNIESWGNYDHKSAIIPLRRKVLGAVNLGVINTVVCVTECEAECGDSTSHCQYGKNLNVLPRP